MSFQNLQVDVDELPQAGQIEFQPLAQAYPRQMLIQHLLVFGPIVLASLIPAVLLVAVFRTPASYVVGPLLPVIPLLLAALLIPLAVRRARTAGVALREHDIAFRRGVFFRKVVILPFNRLQHAGVSSGPLQRRFGLASLKLYTAGASGIDLQIDGLTAERAATLREHVTARTGDAVDG
ncbi:MAG: PH domain-containing protein [bacterium]|nr:PH domain-containing protein [bacterium]